MEAVESFERDQRVLCRCDCQIAVSGKLKWNGNSTQNVPNCTSRLVARDLLRIAARSRTARIPWGTIPSDNDSHRDTQARCQNLAFGRRNDL